MKSIVFLFFWTAAGTCFGQRILARPAVDTRVEMLSIVFRLAGSDEYGSQAFRQYTDRINTWYRPYQNHELIRFARQLRKERGVGYDAVMRMAVHVDADFNPLVPFTDQLPDNRWGKDNADKFIRLLKDFYRETKSRTFFRSNKQIYRKISDGFFSVYDRLDVAWYSSFYGKKPEETFTIVNAPGNGEGNYGVSFSRNGAKKKVYAIMGTWETDSTGMAAFSMSSYFPLLVHEFNHSFVNPLIEKNAELLKDDAVSMYKAVEKQMNNGGYRSWKTMHMEALVRAAVIKYMKDHRFPPADIAAEMNEQIYGGFLWMEDLVSALEEYDRHRDIYPTLESYFPVLIKAYKDYARNINGYKERYLTTNAKVVSFGEFINGDRQVNSSLKQITIHFDRPFTETNFIGPGSKEKAFPNFKKLSYSTDRKSVTLEWTLEANKEYQFVLIGLSPDSPEGEKRGLTVNFKTK